jgi:hypothetical protein
MLSAELLTHPDMKKPNKTTKPKALTPATTKKKSVKTTPAVKKPAPVVKQTAPVPVLTTIAAAIDVGFGNTLYLRGEGPGLSWERGIPMNCVSDEKWSIALGESSGPVVFKFLLNDETWCAGDDYTLPAGQNGTFTPEF